MHTLRCVKKSRAFLQPLTIDTSFFLYSTNAAAAAVNSLLNPLSPSSPALLSPTVDLKAEDIVLSFREWFKYRGNPLFDRIYEILASQGQDDDLTQRRYADLALSRLGLRLTEGLVLDVLAYGKDVLLCLKFFDWAGRQHGFFHTPVTFNAIFKILFRAKLMSLMLDFLDSYGNRRSYGSVGFYNTLVMGYAVAGKPEVALHIFGKMRFNGVDLDGFSYHVLLNALVEADCFDVVNTVAKQIRLQGFESDVTHSILVKSFCKQGELDMAEGYFRGLIAGGVRFRKGYIVCFLVDGFCKNNQFEKAGKLVEEFGESHVYDIWIRELVRVRKLEGALEFMQRNNQKSLPDRYVPDVFRYNTLIWRLLRENRLQEVCDLLIEMKENNREPDELTLNYVLCFFCKVGMSDVALHLFDSRGEFGLSPSSMAYNYLINTLCGDGSVDDAYRVLKNSIDQGYFPGKKTFFILADALCRLEKLDTMKELVLVALDHNFMPSTSTFEKFISALCRTSRVEDGYMVHELVSRLNKVTSKSTFYRLINGCSMSNRGDIAARLLIEMQDKGLEPTRKLFRTVIQSLCAMENGEEQFWRLLEMQLSRQEQSFQVYNLFISGAGHAKRPDLAIEVYETMRRKGIAPTLKSDILMLQSYLKSEKFNDCLHFFDGLAHDRKIGYKLRNAIVIGLCKANMLELALLVFFDLRKDSKKPSLDCYEELVSLLCKHKRYRTVIYLVDDLIKVGRPISSFIGNQLLYHSFETGELYGALESSRNDLEETSWISTFRELISELYYSRGEIRDIEVLEEVIRKCFRLNLFTYNLLLRKLCMNQMDDACKLFKKLCQIGYEPNQWTFDTLVHGFYRHGMTTDARIWEEEMYRRGYYPIKDTERSRFLSSNVSMGTDTDVNGAVRIDTTRAGSWVKDIHGWKGVARGDTGLGSANKRGSSGFGVRGKGLKEDAWDAWAVGYNGEAGLSTNGSKKVLVSARKGGTGLAKRAWHPMQDYGSFKAWGGRPP